MNLFLREPNGYSANSFHGGARDRLPTPIHGFPSGGELAAAGR